MLATREPGGTPVAERVRELVLHGDEMSPWAEAALYAAARAENVAAVIRPRSSAVPTSSATAISTRRSRTRVGPGARRGAGTRAEPARHRRAAARPHLRGRARPRRGAPPRRQATMTGSSGGAGFMRRVADAYRALADAEPDESSSSTATVPRPRSPRRSVSTFDAFLSTPTRPAARIGSARRPGTRLPLPWAARRREARSRPCVRAHAAPDDARVFTPTCTSSTRSAR